MEKLLTDSEVCDLVPGLTRAGLAQMRFKGTGPNYIKPSPRKIVYRQSDIERWLEESRVTIGAH